MVCTGTPFYFYIRFLYGMRSDSFRTERAVTVKLLGADSLLKHSPVCSKAVVC